MRTLSLISTLAGSVVLLSLAACSGDAGSGTGTWEGEPGAAATAAPTHQQPASTATTPPASTGTTPPASTGTTPPTSTGTAPPPADAGPPPDAAPPPTTATYVVSVDNAAPTVNLLDSATINVSIAPEGYTGDVALSVLGLPTGVTAKFGMASVTLDGKTTVSTTLALGTLSSTAPGPVSFSVVGMGAGSITASAKADLTVASELTITVPPNVNNNGGTTGAPVKNAFGTYPITITAPANISSSNPVVIHFFNGDTVSHEIHASSPGAGFPHGSGLFAPNTMEPTKRAITMKGTYDFYLHNQGAPKTIGRLILQ